ncbi:uncharacterized protein LOC131066493 isoform X2 [Cryptomeria japonica]|uniref:uncharacterized protein LOC131066493 isoform X2 n=1 Tax=Cryptomeria japonica TaxID=3369 RepID=UPI0027D9E14D|nr:uncharacterized protein LOC131066493 isoform X2 [Cryptomeria japonica]
MEGLCSDVLHNSCLLLLLKGSSSPTGYTCPSCKSQIWPTKKHFVSSGSSLANQLEELFAKSHIFMLDKNSLLPLASELLSNFSEQGFSQPRSEIRSIVFSLSSPLAEMYKDPKSQKAQQNHIPKDQNVLESWETLKSPRKTINIETPKSCSPEIGIAESVGSPKISVICFYPINFGQFFISYIINAQRTLIQGFYFLIPKIKYFAVLCRWCTLEIVLFEARKKVPTALFRTVEKV